MSLPSTATRESAVRAFIGKMKKSAEEGELYGFAADCDRLLSLLSENTRTHAEIGKAIADKLAEGNAAQIDEAARNMAYASAIGVGIGPSPRPSVPSAAALTGETPRTDARAFKQGGRYVDEAGKLLDPVIELVNADFARQLERELAHVRKENDLVEAENDALREQNLAMNKSLVSSEAGMVLDKPAQIGATRFGVGVKWSTVIDRAQREWDYFHGLKNPRSSDVGTESANAGKTDV